MQLFVDGKTNAFLGFPPCRKSCARGASVVCCSAPRKTTPGRNTFAACLPETGDYVRKYPVATKRVLSAILKAAWDGEAGVWVASSDNVPGLATGTNTFDEGSRS
jgi:NitT/TauT family transport system substrate-binding protein